MLFSTANIGFGRSIAGVGDGRLSVSFVGRFGVADGLSAGVSESLWTVAAGEGETTILGPGVGAEYLPLRSPPPPRVMSHAINTPEAPITRTIANTHGKAPLLDSPRSSSALTCL
jgi:hypothetical protein